MGLHHDPRIIEACDLLDRAHQLQNCSVSIGGPVQPRSIDSRMAEAAQLRAAARDRRLAVFGR